ncbi:hypothetical protein PENSPDRAFT_752111 [Peniophora sp. CONT]|nr:hypothetical protein PENSPDRAFT_752111 [Peniophora sp. CONT]
MSSREPMWYCHECHAEMRPLMVPDPHCASCNGTFVEKIEGEEDDPRAFQESGPALDLDDEGGPPGDLLANLMQVLASGPMPPRGASSLPGQAAPASPASLFSDFGGSGLRFEISRSGPGGTQRTFVLGGPNTLGRGAAPGSPPAGVGATPGGTTIGGNLFAQYLLSMLANHGGQGANGTPFPGLMGDLPENGRWGDYVFNQEALDEIVTQLMEGNNTSRPVPATEEVMKKLDRTVLEEGSPLLERDCAVCKDQFSATAEEPGEQVVVTLPCKHPFHEGCIEPWLKTSGTCPVCRHQLVPQPSHHDRPTSPGSGSSGSSASPPNAGSPGNNSSGGGGILNSLLSMVGGAGNSTSTSGSGSGNQAAHANNAPSETNENERRRSGDAPPGGWWD